MEKVFKKIKERKRVLLYNEGTNKVNRFSCTKVINVKEQDKSTKELPMSKLI